MKTLAHPMLSEPICLRDDAPNVLAAEAQTCFATFYTDLYRQIVLHEDGGFVLSQDGVGLPLHDHAAWIQDVLSFDFGRKAQMRVHKLLIDRLRADAQLHADFLQAGNACSAMLYRWLDSISVALDCDDWSESLLLKASDVRLHLPRESVASHICDLLALQSQLGLTDLPVFVQTRALLTPSEWDEICKCIARMRICTLWLECDSQAKSVQQENICIFDSDLCEIVL